MKQRLNEKQTEYVFFHLNHHLVLSREVKERFAVGNNRGVKNRIIFPLNDREMNIRYVDEIPVLYPVENTDVFYSMDTNNNLVFHHDLIKSAFYLLSGYQETLPFNGDVYGRFSYEDSIQKQLEIAEIPLVNVYFDIIIDGIGVYCRKHGLPFERRDWWTTHPAAFVLTHDVDRVDKYTFHNLKLYAKQALGLKSSSFSKRESIHLFIKTLFKLFGKENPYWNFDWMKEVEKRYGLRSAWYFLPKGKKHLDAYYSFDEKRIGELIKKLQDNGDEIGLHGTYRSRLDAQIMKENYDTVANLIGRPPFGCRQHWLSFKYPETLRIMKSIGIKYDSSWGFADHVGWRNSYCWPFRPWDFEKDNMMDLWELPLSVMDTTIFSYQKCTFPEAKESIKKVVDQVIKYRGILVMLWHNSYLDDEDRNGISDFYDDLLEYISKLNMKSLLPAEIITKFDSIDYEKN